MLNFHLHLSSFLRLQSLAHWLLVSSSSTCRTYFEPIKDIQCNDFHATLTYRSPIKTCCGLYIYGGPVRYRTGVHAASNLRNQSVIICVDRHLTDDLNGYFRVSGLCLLLQTLFRFHTRRNSYTTWANPKLVELRPNLQIISLTYCSVSSNPQALVHFMNTLVDAGVFTSLQFFHLCFNS